MAIFASLSDRSKVELANGFGTIGFIIFMQFPHLMPPTAGVLSTHR